MELERDDIIGTNLESLIAKVRKMKVLSQAFEYETDSPGAVDEISQNIGESNPSGVQTQGLFVKLNEIPQFQSTVENLNQQLNVDEILQKVMAGQDVNSVLQQSWVDLGVIINWAKWLRDNFGMKDYKKFMQVVQNPVSEFVIYPQGREDIKQHELSEQRGDKVNSGFVSNLAKQYLSPDIPDEWKQYYSDYFHKLQQQRLYDMGYSDNLDQEFAARYNQGGDEGLDAAAKEYSDIVNSEYKKFMEQKDK